MSDADRARRLYSEGVFLYSQGRYTEAIEKWSEVTRLPDTGEWGARAVRGIERAQTIFNLASGVGVPSTAESDVDPDARELYSEGVLHYSQGRYEDAIESWEEVLLRPGAGPLADRAAEHIERAKKILDLARNSPEGGLEKHQDYPRVKHETGPGECWCGVVHPDKHAPFELNCEKAQQCWCEAGKHCGAGVGR